MVLFYMIAISALYKEATLSLGMIVEKRDGDARTEQERAYIRGSTK